MPSKAENRILSGAKSDNLIRINRACNSCRIRKVKCDGGQPCSQCSHLDLPCIRTASKFKRKNPKRGQLMALARISAGGRKSVVVDAGPVVDADGPVADSFCNQTCHLNTSLALNPQYTCYTPEFFLRLIHRFEEFVFPVNNAVSVDEIRRAIINMNNSLEDAAFIYAFAAVTIHTSDAEYESLAPQIDRLLQHSLDAHRRIDLIMDNQGHNQGHSKGHNHDLVVSIKRAMTCLFLESVSTSSSRQLMFLREAVTMIQILMFRQQTFDQANIAKCQRLYWQAVFHERYLTLASSYPNILPPLQSGLPITDASIPVHIETGFNCMIQLFIIMDSRFLRYWNGQNDKKLLEDLDANYIEHKQAQLDEDEAAANYIISKEQDNGVEILTEFQRVDLFVTRLWFRTLVWQLALAKGLLTSSSSKYTHDGLSLQYPLQKLFIQLRNLVVHLESSASISTQGKGIMLKLFDIISTIGDILTLPFTYDEEKNEVSEQVTDFVFVVEFLFQFQRLQEEHKEYLKEKLNLLQELYPLVESKLLMV